MPENAGSSSSEPDTRRPVALVDIDGTLVNVDKQLLDFRLHRDLDRFHRETNAAGMPNTWVLGWCADQVAQGRELIVLTGRSDAHRAGTQAWLDRHVGTPITGVIMRRSDDHRPDYEVKREAHSALAKRGFDVVAAIDDRPQVLALWRELDVPEIMVVHSNDWAHATAPEYYSEADLMDWANQAPARADFGDETFADEAGSPARSTVRVMPSAGPIVAQQVTSSFDELKRLVAMRNEAAAGFIPEVGALNRNEGPTFS